jgi:hypothetical protein
MSPDMTDLFRAKEYRARALVFRDKAALTMSEELRVQYCDLASDYEVLAESLERQAKRLTEGEPSS